MSKVSDVYDDFLAALGDLFPSKTYISNPYSLEDNKYPFLIDGYGLRVDDESDNAAVFNFFNTSHTFTVILTRELKRMESDSVPVHDVVKLLKEDVFSLKTALYNSADISSDIELINFGTVSGVNFLLTDNNSFMSIEASFLVVINEQAANC
jgi:hypothetical protein